MTLHLTRDEADRLDADGWVVLFREGVAYMPAEMWGRPGPEQLPTRPPAEFVEAAKPCETCERTGIVDAWVNGPGDVTVRRCPDCLDGKRIVTVQVECQACRGRGFNMIQLSPTSQEVAWCTEPDCDDGLVTVAIVVVEWGPLVVVDPIARNPSLSHKAWVEVYGNQDKIGRQALVFLTPPPSKSIDITATLTPDVDPATLVGQYALGIRKVEP